MQMLKKIVFTLGMFLSMLPFTAALAQAQDAVAQPETLNPDALSPGVFVSLLNISVLVFLGWLIWLYFREKS